MIAAGAIVWFTGRPASGKTTLAERVLDCLRGAREQSVLLDSDAMRPVIAPDVGYAPHERTEFYRRLATFAALLAERGSVVLVAATAPERRHRAVARALWSSLIEVFVSTPLETCALRDRKALYARAASGAAPFVPGAGVAYEEPETPDLVATGGRDAAAAERILQLLTAARA